jgi:uncharacterized protein (TIGR02001 family)
MRTSIRALVATTALTLGFAASPAFAQDEADAPITLSGYVQGVNDYRFRGLSLSGGDFALQGSINANHSSGFYAGAFASSLDGENAPFYGDVELDIYAGWTGEVTPGVTFDAGLLRYVYPSRSDKINFGPADFWEPYASVATTVGPVSDKDDNLDVFTDLSAGIPTTPLTINAHVGYADGVQSPKYLTGVVENDGSLSDDGGFDYSAGVTWNVTDKLSISATYVGVEGRSFDEFSDDTVVAAVKLAL